MARLVADTAGEDSTARAAVAGSDVHSGSVDPQLALRLEHWQQLSGHLLCAACRSYGAPRVAATCSLRRRALALSACPPAEFIRLPVLSTLFFPTAGHNLMFRFSLWRVFAPPRV